MSHNNEIYRTDYVQIDGSAAVSSYVIEHLHGPAYIN